MYGGVKGHMLCGAPWFRCCTGDALWDTPRAQKQLVVSMRNLLKPLSKEFGRGKPRFFLRRVGCKSKHMVSASNCAIHEAYTDGAEYWLVSLISSFGFLLN